MPKEITIRDPIHGDIEIKGPEITLLDSPFFQRLRHIQQLGFTVLAFPGATHSRYLHSAGAMYLATKIYDTIFTEDRLPREVRLRFRQTLRLAMLLHDVGHAPLSHSSETVMPPIKDLKLESFLNIENPQKQACHEDYTYKIVLDSSLAETIRQGFGDQGITPEAVACLISADLRNFDNSFFMHEGLDYSPVLKQIVSSELDADRMDYLTRDSYFTGASYGQYDMSWLVQNLQLVEEGGKVFLGLTSRAIFTFEDFLLSRYHMFISVYYHYKTICFDYMLHSYYREEPEEYSLPSDMEEYLKHDDGLLWSILMQSNNRWAKMLTLSQNLKLVFESNEPASLKKAEGLWDKLQQEGIEGFEAKSEGVLSKYFELPRKSPPIWVPLPMFGENKRIEDYTPLYKRYGQPIQLYRLYCMPGQENKARKITKDWLQRNR